MRSHLAVIAAIAALPAHAGPVSIGIKTGVPVTDVIRTAGQIGGRPFRADVKRFTIGPVLNIHLPLGFGVEFGVMYKRFDQHAGQYHITGEPGGPFEVRNLPYSQTGRSWEFPLVGQYRFPGRAMRPYLEVGASFNRLDDVLAPFRIPFTLTPSPVAQPGGSSENRRGLVIGGGLELKLPLVRVIPGLRYTRYGETRSWLPGADAVDFLVGFTF